MALYAHDYPPTSNVIGLASTSSTSVQITDLVGAATAAYSQSQSRSLSDSSHSGSPSSHRSNSYPRPSRDETPPHSGPGVATYVRRPTKAQLKSSLFASPSKPFYIRDGSHVFINADGKEAGERWICIDLRAGTESKGSCSIM